jgi:hypothetical protein
VFAVLAVTPEIERKTGPSIRKIVQTPRRYRTSPPAPPGASSRPTNPYLTYATPSPRSPDRAVRTASVVMVHQPAQVGNALAGAGPIQIARSIVSSTRPVVLLVAARQPRMRRA